MESFRNVEGKPRQRTICTLGRLEPGSEVDTLIASLQRAQGVTAAPSVLDGLRFTESRHAGDIWALSELWRSLGFDDLALAWRRSKSEVNAFTLPVESLNKATGIPATTAGVSTFAMV